MLSSLLAFASGLAAKVALPVKRDPIDIEIIVALQTELDDLRRELNETRLLLEATRPLRRAQSIGKWRRNSRSIGKRSRCNSTR